ncbi:MAG: chorismate mutase [bacterium]
MATRGIRGATTALKNDKTAILEATKELLLAIVKENKLIIEDIASIQFSVTPDLNADFPAAAARNLGWSDTPLICMTEINVPGALPKCIRVLLLVNSAVNQRDLKHIYLKDAVNLRR